MQLRSPVVLRESLPARLTTEPWAVLWPLAIVQWILLVVLTQKIVHNGWLFSQRGSATAVYSTAWSLAHGHLPPALVGYGWPLLTTPIAGVAGANLVDGLPAIVVIQAALLLPLSLLLVYGLASRLAGRTVGYVAAAAWVLLPYAAHPLFVSSYHPLYVQQLLPEGLGLTDTGDFASMICVLTAAYFIVASIDLGDEIRACVGGLFAGFAIAVDPGNVLFLAAPLVGYALARRWRTALAFGVALLPTLVTVALWQYRGLGHFPHFHAQIDFHRLHVLSIDFRNVFYSDRLVELPFIAGVIGLGRRSWTKAAFVAAWALAYVLVRGSAAGTSVGSGSWFSAFMPALPAFVIACAALLLLVPRLGERLAEAPLLAGRRRFSLRDRPVVAAVAVLAALPLLVIAALPVQKGPALVGYAAEDVLVPVEGGLVPTASGGVQAVQLFWKARSSGGAKTFYTVFRSPADESGGVDCARHGAERCTLTMQAIGTSVTGSYLDFNPPVPAGRWTYRVGLTANWHADPGGGGLVALSPPVDAEVH